MEDTQVATNGTNGETVDQKIDKLAIAVKEGFDAADQKVDRLAIAVKEGFDAVVKRLGTLEEKTTRLEEKTTRIEATMVTKSYLDEKLFGLKGDLITKIRKLEGGMLFMATVLRERQVFSDDDVKRMRAEYQVFPSLDRT